MRARSIELPFDITATKGYPFTAADDRQPGAGVAAGELDHRLPGPQSPLRLGVLDDLPRDPVFLRKAGIQVFQLGENPAVKLPAEPPQLDQRRLPDRVDGGAQNTVVSVHLCDLTYTPYRDRYEKKEATDPQITQMVQIGRSHGGGGPD